MTKKILFGMMAATMMFATSCENELDLGTNAGETAQVTFSVGTPEIATRAFSDGLTATVLQYAVYDAEGNELTELTKTDAEIHGSTTVNLQLTTGNTYSVIFWAAAEDAPYTVDFGTKTMTVDYSEAVSNEETRDAFYKYHTFTVTGAQTETIELKRPFAQLNIGTNDYAASESAGYTPTHSAVTVKNVYKTLNLATGVVENEVEVTYESAAIPTGETFPVTGYEYLAMNYLLVAADKALVDIEFAYTDGSNEKTRTVGSVPVQRNYRTNIYGNLLTSAVDVNVVIEPEYEDSYLETWDGTTLNEPTFDANTNTYYISHAAELAYIAQLVNGTLDTDNVTRTAVEANNLKGYTVKLEADIDLNGKEWTPIGFNGKQFYGIFDGQGNTIHNLVINAEGKSNVGLFGDTRNGEIKNLVVNNAKITGRLNVGVVAGNPYTSKYTGITVKGHVEVNGMAYVGGVGGKNAYANWTNVTVNVDESSYVNANSVENGTAYRTYVGGVVGFNGEGGHTFSNIKSNINVKGSTCDVGGLFGIAHYGNNFLNCESTGDVEIYAANEEADAQEIGGIAGVWMNSNATQPVTFTNCKFSGTLTANNGYVINTNKFTNLVCAAYNADGAGKLIIDGVEYMQTKNGVKVDGSVLVENGEALAAALEAGEDVALATDLADVAVNTQAPYGNYYGVAQNGGVIDGYGHTLDFDLGELKDGKADNYGIMTSGGTIKNMTITGVFRGIMIMAPTEDVIIDNVTIGDEDVCYAINTGEGDGTHSLSVSNSTIKGWSSYGTAIKDLTFTNCTFAQGEYYTNVFGRLVKPYVNTLFDGCEFNSKFYIDLSAFEGEKVTLKNCTVNGVKLTADNWKDLIVSEDNCGNGQISVELKNGSYLTAENVVDYIVFE